MESARMAAAGAMVAAQESAKMAAIGAMTAAQALTPRRCGVDAQGSQGLLLDGRPDIKPRIPSVVAPAEVTLHVYSVGTTRSTQIMNCILWRLGTGFYHCGVEVFGNEWSFSGSPSIARDGIFCSVPRRCGGHTYRESLLMGTTTTSYSDFVIMLEALWKEDWAVTQYNILTHNCVHFCDLLCEKLGVGPIPDWVKNLANTGAAIGSARNRFMRGSCCVIPGEDAQTKQLVEQVEVTNGKDEPVEVTNGKFPLVIAV
mmetsp:Transcript_124869/g.249348  ORF Transcript_124869/g.249348 Transcript_124869/m.249348 type:complete len:257 (-) Transcript_124869:79-849(-)